MLETIVIVIWDESLEDKPYPLGEVNERITRMPSRQKRSVCCGSQYYWRCHGCPSQLPGDAFLLGLLIFKEWPQTPSLYSSCSSWKCQLSWNVRGCLAPLVGNCDKWVLPVNPTRSVSHFSILWCLREARRVGFIPDSTLIYCQHTYAARHPAINQESFFRAVVLQIQALASLTSGDLKSMAIPCLHFSLADQKLWGWGLSSSANKLGGSNVYLNLRPSLL